jgi:hypothetical protein
MRNRKVFFVLFCIVAVSPFGVALNVAGEEFGTHVSIINLIATPEKYHGEKVLVDGYMVFDFESNGLYLTKGSADNSMTKDALWLSLEEFFDKLPEEVGGGYLRLNESYVMVEGVFDAEDKGHFDLYSGAISKISRIKPAINRYDDSWKSRVKTIK